MDVVWRVAIIVVVTFYNTDAACNGTTTKRKVGAEQIEYASSPGYPNSNYTNNLTCRWVFEPKCQNKGRLHVEFADMDIQRPVGLNCVDHIDLYKGQTPTSGLKIARMCGNPGYETYHGDIKGKLLIIFHSDATETGKGFYAKITCVNEEEFPVAAVAAPVIIVSFIVIFCIFKKKHAIAVKRQAEAAAAKKKAEEAKKKAEEAKKKANATSAASTSSPTTDTTKKVGVVESATQPPSTPTKAANKSPTNIATTTTDISSTTHKIEQKSEEAMAIQDKKVPRDEVLYWSPNVSLATPRQNGAVNLTQVHVLPASNQMPVMMTNPVSLQTSNVANNHSDNVPIRQQQIPIQHEFCSVDILPPPYSEI
ncbi:hypothetical protein SNE40_021561 [Patella caerulea]|uniref:CUB domain-containing protein n=1 Tax=Patella caerulea TaxID=87958 RepID=A0AAN8G4N9_PATCE